MKIVMGKFSSEPFHALSKKDLNLLFKLVPNEWATHVSSVIMSSKVFKQTKLTKPLEYMATSKQLNIYSRGLLREEMARHVLYELASIAAAQQENSATSAELDAMVKPLIAKFLKVKL